MMKYYLLRTNFDPILKALVFMRRHWMTLLGFSLVGGFGRVIQLGGFGEVSPLVHWLLEVVIEGSRVAMLLFVIGLANVGRGFWQIVRLFSGKIAIGKYVRAVWETVKTRWMALLFSFTAFALMAAGMNLFIDHLAYETCLYLTLKREGVLADKSSEWTILLFFKNISVIPFTLVFETCLLLWLVNRWPASRAVS